MSAETTSSWSTQLSSGPEIMTLPRYSFVQQSENVNASRTRRAVRSHAMKAVRRQQRQESVKTFRLKWPDEYSSSKESVLTWPGEQSSGIEERQKRPQLEWRVPEGTDGEDVFNSNPSLESAEPDGSHDEYDPLHLITELGQKSSSVEPPHERPESLHPLRRPFSLQHATAEPDRDITSTGTHARTFLGAGRVDPFQTFPVYADLRMSELIDHCMSPSHTCD